MREVQRNNDVLQYLPNKKVLSAGRRLLAIFGTSTRHKSKTHMRESAAHLSVSRSSPAE